MRRPYALISLATLTLLVLAGSVQAALRPKAAPRERRVHKVYFANTPYQLDVYHIYGRQPGKTLMIVGGIQGNEPGGFLSADLYTDITLAKGNLIVVPRANLRSIILFHRGPTGDMNRRFASSSERNYDEKIVAILKKLMAQSDYFLNLHDGSGFYHPRWISRIKNPLRYGQSIIADTGVYVDPRTGRKMDLGGLARKVVAAVNRQIKNRRYHFRFNNHRTSKVDTLHAEQRKSATFFALTKHGLWAYGIETSKSLPNTAVKVRLHALVINEFMRHWGIVPESPPIYLARPRLKYLVVSVNNNIPVALADRTVLTVHPGDRITITHIEANYRRGLTADVQGLGTLNDYRQPLTVDRSTRIVVRKDHVRCGLVFVRVEPRTDRTATRRLDSKMVLFIVKVNGLKRLVEHGEHLSVVKGDRIQIVEVLTNIKDQSDLKVNFKGFVPPRADNQGEDRGYVIDTGRQLQRRFSLRRDRESYAVIATRAGKFVGRILVDLLPPRMDYLVVGLGRRRKMAYANGETVRVHRGDVLKIVAVKTNFTLRGNVRFFVRSLRSGRMQECPGGTIRLRTGRRLRHRGPDYQIVVKRDDIPIGRVYIQLN
ncbi:MAG: hypothetical protein KJ621_12815 [Proteobacteria bacterium]|nr:hypothetical protein [Pseudomonadota bacterium]